MWFICAFIIIFTTYCEGQAENKTTQNLIIGGSKQKIIDAPYFALYLLSNQPICGASIISEKILLTAAHCYFPNQKYSVKVGTHSIDRGLQYNVKKTIIHPKYDRKKYSYDIAVIKIVGRLQFSERVSAIHLAPRNIVLNHGDMLTTMGFGKTETKQQATKLLKVDVPYISQEKCRKIKSYFTDTILCAGGVEGNDACNGDSGGPLVYNDMLVGIVSFGIGECGEELPGGYARISALRDFIDTTVYQLSTSRG